MSGYELAAKLRAGEFCPPSLKLIAVTGYAKDAEALATAGFDGYLIKPIDFEQSESTLAGWARYTFSNSQFPTVSEPPQDPRTQRPRINDRD